MKAERDAWRDEFATVAPEHLIFLDESSTNTTMDRTHGRAPSGVAVDGPVPHGHWQATTLTAAVRLDGVIAPACMAANHPTNGESFGDYVEEALVPTLRSGDIVIMDNLSSHKSVRVAKLIEKAGATLRLLPAYSPDLNPIEKMFSKVKAILRRLKARTFEALVAALGEALNAVELSDIRGWFGHAGYRATPSSDTPGEKPV